jgi:hypothetical protein
MSAKYEKSDKQAQNIVNTAIVSRFPRMQWVDVKRSKEYKEFSAK